MWTNRGCRLALGVLLCGAMQAVASAHWRCGFQNYARPICVTDCYGYHGWHAPLVGFDSSFFLSTGGYYRSSFSEVRYGAWGWAPVVYPAYPLYPGVVVQQTVFPMELTIVRGGDATAPRAPIAVEQPRQPNVFDIVQQHAERRAGIPNPPDDAAIVRPVSASSRAGRERSLLAQAEGDRWLREGQHVKAYLRYLEAQREAEDRAEVYFRQAFALVAMGRYSHAVMRLKRGLQVDPAYPRTGATLDTVYGIENLEQKVDYLRRVTDWANADARDPDRLFLMGVMLHFDEDSRANEFFSAAWKLSGSGDHLKAFLKEKAGVVTESSATVRQADTRRVLPPPPQDEVAPAKALPPPPAPHNAVGPRLTPLAVPPEPSRRELISPDVD